jgi:hypothetical protein
MLIFNLNKGKIIAVAINIERYSSIQGNSKAI